MALIADCVADEACHSAFPGLAKDFVTVLADLERRRVRFALHRVTGAPPQSVTLSRQDFAHWLTRALDDLPLASRLPLLIHRAARWDWSLLGTEILGRSRGDADVIGTYLTVACSESVPGISEADITYETRDTFIGDYYVRALMEACREWPRGAVAASFYEPVRSTAPVLMLSGALDVATPPRWGTMAAQSLPNGRQLLFPKTAHAYGARCVMSIIVEFLARGSAVGMNTSCVEHLRRPPFLTPGQTSPNVAAAPA